MTDNDLMSHLRAKLNNRLKNKIAGNRFESLSDMIVFLQNAEADFAEMTDHTNPGGGRVGGRFNEGRRAQGDGTRPTQSFGGQRSNNARSSATPTPSKNTSSTSFKPPLNDALRRQLRAENKCFRCREVGHITLNCPLNQLDNRKGGTNISQTTAVDVHDNRSGKGGRGKQISSSPSSSDSESEKE